MSMSYVGLTFLVASCLAIMTIFCMSFKRPASAIALLVASLPVLNLVRKAFPEKAPPFPSLETLAIVALLCGVSFWAMMGGQQSENKNYKMGKGGLLFLPIFITFAVLSTIMSENWGLSSRILLVGVFSPTACFYMASKYVRTPEDRNRVIVGIIMMAIIAGLYTLMNYVNRSGQAVSAFSSGYGWMYNEAPVVNFFVVPSAAVAAVIPVIPLSLWYWVHGRRFRLPILIAGLSSVLLISLLSFSRGSWIATAFIGLCSLLYLFRGNSIRTIVLLAVMFILLVFTGVRQFAAPIVESRMKGTTLSQSRTVKGRAIHYKLALRSGLHHPIIGVGLGSYPLIFDEFGFERIPYVWFAHSLILTLIPEIGAMGAAAFALLLTSFILGPFFWRGRPKSEEDLDRSISLGLLGFVLVASTSGCHLISYLMPIASQTYYSAPVTIVVFTLMGILSSRTEMEPMHNTAQPARGKLCYSKAQSRI